MASPNFTILFDAQVSGTALAGAAGDVLIPDATTGLYTLATSAARGTRRATGLALGTYQPLGVVGIQQSGQVDALTSGLGAGAASWVRVSTAGRLERCTPSGTDDVVGLCETDGTFHALFGVLTAAIVNGGGGGATLPIDLTSQVTGTLPPPNGGTGLTSAPAGGFAGVTAMNSGDAASVSTAATNASTAITAERTTAATLTGKTIAGASNTLSVRIGNDVTGLGTGVATFLGTPSGANLASALTSALPVSKGGTNRTALGTSLQVLRTNSAATDTEWATISGGGVIGNDTQVAFNNAGTMTGDSGLTYTIGSQQLEVVDLRVDGTHSSSKNNYFDNATLASGNDLLQIEQALTSDFSNATTTLANSNLSFTMEGGSSWKVTLALTVQGNTGGTGIQLALSVPSGATVLGFFTASTGTMPTTTSSFAQVTAVAPTAFASLALAASQVSVVLVELVVSNPTTAGSFVVQTKSGAAPAALLKANSALTARRTTKV